MNTPDIEALIRVEFTKAIPHMSWYRHENWPAGQLKQFTHAHTMAQNIDGFEFYNPKLVAEKPVKMDKAWRNRGGKIKYPRSIAR